MHALRAYVESNVSRIVRLALSVGTASYLLASSLGGQVYAACSTTDLSSCSTSTGVTAVSNGSTFLQNMGVTILNVIAGVGGIVVVGFLLWNIYRIVGSAHNPQGRSEAVRGLMYSLGGGIAAFAVYDIAGYLKFLATQAGGG